MEVSKAYNINLGDENWASVQDVIDSLDGDGKTSLLQDVENKRKNKGNSRGEIRRKRNNL